MTVQVLNDFHGDGVFRDQQGTIWVRQSEMVESMTIEEEIARALREEMKHDGDFDPDYDYTEDSERYTAALSPFLNRVRAEALREFRQRLINRQTKQYGIVLPDVHEIVDDLDHVAICIEQNSEGSET